MRFLLCTSLLALAACAATPSETVAPVAEAAPEVAAPEVATRDAYAGTSWKLVEADGGPLQADAIGSGVTMLFSDGKVSGYGGCNRYIGSYAVEDGKLVFGPIASTKMLCRGAKDEAERAFHAWLQQPLERVIDAADLRLRGEKDGITLVFVADAVPAQ